MFTEIWLGRILDSRYEVVQNLGVGGAAEVYRVVLKDIQRDFAAKIFTNKAIIAAERWKREAASLGKLRNPHVVRLVEVIEEDEYVILITEYVEGKTIRELLRRFPEGLAIHRALEILRQIANGIHEAHLRGIIHRDLKPDNIIIQSLPGIGDFAKILDFGLVKLKHEKSSETIGFVGTAEFASPEQIANENLNVQTDIYALGGVLFYMLTGRAPFNEDSLMKTLQAQMAGDVPSLNAIREEFKNWPGLDQLISAMLSKSQFDRPESAAEVCELIAFLAPIKEDEASTSTTSILGTGSEVVENPAFISITSEGEVVSCKDNELNFFSTTLQEDTLEDISFPEGDLSALFALSKCVLYGTSQGGVGCLNRIHREFKIMFEDPRRAKITAIAGNKQMVVVAASESGRLYASKDGKDFRRIDNAPDVEYVAVASHHALIGTASDRQICLYHLSEKGKWKKRNCFQSAKVRDLAISNLGDVVAVLDFNGTSTLYDAEDGQVMSEYWCNNGVPVGIAFNGNSDLVTVQQNGSELNLVLVGLDSAVG